MPSRRPLPHPETYRPYLTDPHAVRGVEVKQNVAQAPPLSKQLGPDLQRVIAHIHDLGLHLVPASELDVHGGRP
jgi:hypothetical protein